MTAALAERFNKSTAAAYLGASERTLDPRTEGREVIKSAAGCIG
jgi:hypothetical protein